MAGTLADMETVDEPDPEGQRPNELALAILAAIEEQFPEPSELVEEHPASEPLPTLWLGDKVARENTARWGAGA